MHILYPHEVKQQPAVAPLELDDDLTRRDSWMFAPLIAIVVALPMVVTVLLAISVVQLSNRDEASASPPPATFASRWPEQALPVIR
jgi:hypothetical protein